MLVAGKRWHAWGPKAPQQDGVSEDSSRASGSGEAGAGYGMGAVSKQGSFHTGDLGKSYPKGKTRPSCRLQLVLSTRGGDVWSFWFAQ